MPTDPRGQVDPFPAIAFESFETVPLAEWGNTALIYDAAAFEAILKSGKLTELEHPSESLKRFEAPRAMTTNWDELAARIGGDVNTVGPCATG